MISQRSWLIGGWDDPQSPRRRAEVQLFRPWRDGWTCGLALQYEGHPSEAQLTLTVALWQVHLWWERQPAAMGPT